MTMSENNTIGTMYQPEPPAPTPQQVKRSFTSHNNFTGGGLILYLCLFMGIQTVISIINLVKVVAQDPTITQRRDEYMEKAMDASMDGVAFIAALVVGLIALFIFFRKRLPLRDIFQSPRKMTGRRFGIILSIFFAGQLVSTAGNALGELILKQFGMSLDGLEESLDGIFGSPSMVLYAAILGPIAEELVFRGFMMRRFQSWGKMFAIVMSSVLFGLFHMNVIQAPFATLVGLVFAYTAMEYGIKWSMLLHILNNGILAFGFSMLEKVLDEKIVTGIEMCVLGVLFLAGLYFVIKYRSSILNYIRRNKTEKHYYGWAFTTCTILIVLIITVGACILTLLGTNMMDI